MGMYDNPPYYLSAYSLAVRRGFVGTLDEWLESLKGEGVQLRNYNNKIQWRRTKKASATEENAPWEDLMDVDQILQDVKKEADRATAAANRVDTTFFGTRYDAAEQVVPLNKEKTVELYLFPNGGGYDAVVAGDGQMDDYPAPKVETGNLETGLIDVEITEERPYADYVQKISRLHIAEGVTYIGDHFMHGAYNLKHLTFALVDDGGKKRTAVTHLGAYAFAYTQISGEYDFSGLQDSTISNAFEACPKLEGLTFSEKVTTIAVKAFQFCLNLRYVHGLAKVTEIGKAAFQYCTCLESIDVVPGNVTLGNWAFILTPNGAVSHDGWKDTGSLCFAQDTWGVQLEDIQSVTADSVSLPIPESDQQKTARYHQWPVFPQVRYDGVMYTAGHRASGCCGIFCLYHIYNILHPNAQYDTFYDFIQREVTTKKIKVTQEVHNAISGSGKGSALIASKAEGFYDVGSEITARDLLMSLDDEDTWGDEGTAFWGVCEALGWTGTETNFDGEENTGAKVKEKILLELAAGRPVMMEIVGADSAGHGMHAVTVIGYDKETDKLQIIDSTWEYPSDIVPMVYWLPFEAMITPDAASAVWTFDFGEVITMTQIDEGLKQLLGQVNSGFRVESGVYEQTADAVDATNGVPVTVACTAGAKLFVFQADDDTYNAISADALASHAAGSTVTKWTLGFAGQGKSALYTAYDQLRGQLTMADAYGTSDGTRFKTADQTMKCWNTDVGGFKFNTLAMKAGKYNWTAYYWNE